MKKIITLEKYLQMGGLLSNLKGLAITTTYTDKNHFQSVVKVELSGRTNSTGDLIYKVTYEKGNTAEYAAMWIDIEVILVLDISLTR